MSIEKDLYSHLSKSTDVIRHTHGNPDMPANALPAKLCGQVGYITPGQQARIVEGLQEQLPKQIREIDKYFGEDGENSQSSNNLDLYLPTP